ncbi:MAG: class I adenylate-forming enzyme family protein, partial [Bacilli bacterium]
GELYVKGPMVFEGYIGKRVSDSFCDGWFPTGDWLERLPDATYRVLDRRTDMYISGGENVYPREIEQFLLNTFSATVIECAIVGVPDEKWGAVGVAFVEGTSQLDLQEVQHVTSQYFAKYKLPVTWVQWKDWPRTSTGKIQKKELLKQWLILKSPN